MQWWKQPIQVDLVVFFECDNTIATTSLKELEGINYNALLTACQKVYCSH